MVSGAFLCGWRKSGVATPEHEVGFPNVHDCAVYLRQELVWLSMDCDPGDSTGDEAMKVAKKLAGGVSIMGLEKLEWELAGFVYYIRRNKPAETVGKWGR